MKIQCNLSVVKMYPAVLKSCAVANTSAHWMPLLFFLTLLEHGGPCLQSMLFIFVAWIYTIITNKQEKKIHIY